MPELNDHELLAEFVRDGSEAAFAMLVARHVNLVYCAALRSTGNPHHAEEITQAVFLILARKAGNLRPGTIISGWLYQTARLTAANFVRGEMRRQHREQEAFMQSTLNEPEGVAWQQIAPLLEEAMGLLGETDRNAVVLRFFENKTAQEAGAVLKLTEAAAHKRLNRALDKLRKFFQQRGVTLTATMIAGAVAANSVSAAPATLAKAVTILAVTHGAAASTSTLTLTQGTIKLMAWTKFKMTAVAVAAVLLAGGTATTLVTHLGRTHGVLPRLSGTVVQFHIKARFLAVPRGTADALIHSPASESFTAILAADAGKTLLRKLEATPGSEILGEPEITVLAGRQTQMRSTKVINVVTNIAYSGTAQGSSESPQTCRVELGPIFDVVPKLTGNGMAHLTVTALDTEFFGYADATGITPDYTNNSAGEKISLPMVLPALLNNVAETQADLADGQMFVMALAQGKPIAFAATNAERDAAVARHIAAAGTKNGAKTIIVLVNVDRVDQAGNRVPLARR